MSKTRRAFIRNGLLASMIPSVSFATGNYGKVLEEAIDNTSKYSAPSDLKITKVLSASDGHGVFLKVLTNQGIVGYGEGVDAVRGTYYLVKLLGEQLVGKSPLNPNVIFEGFRKGNFFGGAQSGVFPAVLSAFDMAMWDLCGKALGLPIYQLLGGKFRDKILVYCDTQLYAVNNPSPDVYAKVGVEAVSKGYKAIKFDIDWAGDPNRFDRWNWTANDQEVQRMYNSIAAVRKAVGPKIEICVDMHGRYDAPTGRKVAKVMEPLNLMWLEEPIPADNVEVYKTITQETSTPICTGENLYLTYGFARLLSEGATDIIMPDLQKCGGLGEGQRIANLANTYYVPFSPHMVSSYMAAMATAHVCASVPNFQILEWQSQSDTQAKWRDIVKFDGPFIVDGYLPLSNKPGIGVELNEEGLKKYAVRGEPFFE